MNLRTTLLAIAVLGLSSAAAPAAGASDASSVECPTPDGIALPSTFCEYVNGVLDDPRNACDTGELGFALAFCEDHGPFEPCPQSHCPPKPGE